MPLLKGHEEPDGLIRAGIWGVGRAPARRNYLEREPCNVQSIEGIDVLMRSLENPIAARLGGAAEAQIGLIFNQNKGGDLVCQEFLGKMQ